MRFYTINIVNTGEDISVDENTYLVDIARKIKLNSKILCAKVNGRLKSLDYRPSGDCSVEFFDISSVYGFRTYQRSCLFMMLAAFNEVFGSDCVVWAEHSIRDNYYCRIYDREPTQEELDAVVDKMRAYSEDGDRIERILVSLEDSAQIFKKYNLTNRLNAIKYSHSDNIVLHKLNNFYEYIHGPLVPETSYIKIFDIQKYGEGFILKFQDPQNVGFLNDKPIYTKLMNVFTESNDWLRILNVDSVYELNQSISKNNFKQNILVSEALHERKIAEIVDKIKQNNKKIVMIAGPSSSGKTTFSKRVAVQMRVVGMNPYIISLDDYYKNREDIPFEADGTRNFERLSTIDVERFNSDMNKLIDGEKVETPLYDFLTGERKAETKAIQLGENDVLIIEGIHGINEKLSYNIPSKDKFKIYICALTQINVDEHNRISTSDTRLIRRIVRDNLYRGTSARQTLEMWDKVLNGEEENIYPYQEEADAMFNSSLIYELSVLKIYAEPLLYDIERGEATYSEARRLLNLLHCFLGVDSQNIPANSIIREFIGGSCFE